MSYPYTVALGSRTISPRDTATHIKEYVLTSFLGRGTDPVTGQVYHPGILNLSFAGLSSYSKCINLLQLFIFME
jgi:hypothetical protein